MTHYASIDTGTSRNATVLVTGEDRATPEHPAARPLWIIDGLWRWQGTPKAPLDIRGVVGAEVGRILRARGISVLAADGIEAAGLRHALTAQPEEAEITLRIQGGELGPSPDGKSIGVYGHGRAVIHERRLIAQLPDPEEVERLIRGLCAVQIDAGRVWLPEDGTDHHDSASAVLRLLWHAGAGLDVARITPPTIGGTSPYAAQQRGAAWYPRP